MPVQYEHIRDSYIKRGKSVKEAKRLGAMTYNAHRKPGVAPVGPHSDEKLVSKKAAKHVKKRLVAARGKKSLAILRSSPRCHSKRQASAVLE